MEQSKQDYINYRIEKAAETFADALLLAQNERWNACVNRLYYASFYIVSALLYSKDIQAQTHNGVKTQFFLAYIKTGVLDKKYSQLYADLFDWRQESDYADFIDFDEKTVKPLLAEVGNFLKVIGSKL